MTTQIGEINSAAKRVDDAMCLGEGLCAKDHARESKTLAAWSRGLYYGRASMRNFKVAHLSTVMKFVFDAPAELLHCSPSCAPLRGRLHGVYSQSRVIDPPASSTLPTEKPFLENKGLNKSK